MASLYNHKRKYKKIKQTEQMKEWRLFEKNIMISHPITVSIIVEGMKIAHILINTDYLVYKTINSIFVRKAGFKHINILIRKLIKIRKKEGRINKVMKIKIDINGHKQDAYFYIIQNHLKYNLILKKPWIKHHDIKIILKADIFFIHSSKIKIRSNKAGKKRLLKLLKIEITAY